MRQQHIDNLEKQLAESKTTLSNFQKTNMANTEQTIKNFNEERLNLNNKVENLKTDLIQKEKEIYNMTQVIELKTSTVSKLESTLADLRSEYEEEKKSLSSKYETL